MDLRENWDQIKSTFDASLRSSLHCAVGTVGADGHPHVTPIGFVFLRDDCTAYYFEEYTKKIPRNLEHNPRVCLLLVNSKRGFWFMSLYRGGSRRLPASASWGSPANGVQRLRKRRRATARACGYFAASRATS
jgi:hypothetical protein